MANVDQNIQSREFDEERLQSELLNSRFRNFAKEKFANSIQFDTDYIDFLRRIAIQEAFKLPVEINDYQIKIDNAPLFWLSDAKILEKAEENFVAKNKRTPVVGDFLEIKKFYSKWITQKSEKEKQFFALSTINLIERNSNELNFIKDILSAVVFSFDKRIYAPDKSIELLGKSEEKIIKSKLPDDVKSEFSYLIHLYKGFINFRSERIDEAIQNFEFAEVHKLNGMSAKLYKAIIENRLGQYDKAVQLIGEIVEYDKARLNFAIIHNNIHLYKFFLDNAAIYNVFGEQEFSIMFYEIENLISTSLYGEDKKIAELNSILERFNDLKINDYLDEQIIRKITFLKDFIKNYSENANILVMDSSQRLIEKFGSILEDIKANITKKFYDEVANEIRIFDFNLDENLKAVEYLKKEKEEVKTKVSSRYEQATKQLEANYNDGIKSLEYKVENIDHDKNLDPSNAFSNAMVYNMIISTVVFIFGGFAGTMIDKSSGNVEGFAGFFSQTMMSGIKWGGITFVLGSLISIFTTMSAVWERANEKQRILRQISYLKNQKDREIDLLRKESESKIKSLIENYEERIEDYKTANASLQKDKTEKYQEYKQLADKKIEKLHGKLDEVLS